MDRDSCPFTVFVRPVTMTEPKTLHLKPWSYQQMSLSLITTLVINCSFPLLHPRNLEVLLLPLSHLLSSSCTLDVNGSEGK